MASKKAGGSSRNGRDSPGKRRGVKKFGSERVRAGNIIVRQLGTRYHPGEGVKCGKDYTIFAIIEGVVKFTRQKRCNKRDKVFVNVVSDEVPEVKQEIKVVKSK